jgi:hypothetical protein
MEEVGSDKEDGVSHIEEVDSHKEEVDSDDDDSHIALDCSVGAVTCIHCGKGD